MPQSALHNPRIVDLARIDGVLPAVEPMKGKRAPKRRLNVDKVCEEYGIKHNLTNVYEFVDEWAVGSI